MTNLLTLLNSSVYVGQYYHSPTKFYLLVFCFGIIMRFLYELHQSKNRDRFLLSFAYVKQRKLSSKGEDKVTFKITVSFFYALICFVMFSNTAGSRNLFRVYINSVSLCASVLGTMYKKCKPLKQCLTTHLPQFFVIFLFTFIIIFVRIILFLLWNCGEKTHILKNI